MQIIIGNLIYGDLIGAIGNLVNTGILTEASDFLITENSDFLIQE